MNNYDRDISVMINGRSYFLSGWGEPHKDGSRKVYMRLNHNSLCQMMQQDGDDETCTCLDELDTDRLSQRRVEGSELSQIDSENAIRTALKQELKQSLEAQAQTINVHRDKPVRAVPMEAINAVFQDKGDNRE